MRSSSVIAIIVSYNGEEKTRETTQALLPQVDSVLIVDNGSDAQSMRTLDELEKDERVAIIRLGGNRGIGYALNAGLLHAQEQGFSWVLTMDQDSVAAPGMVGAMLAAHARDTGALCLSPNLVLHGEAKAAVQAGTVKYAITSGNLVSMDIYRSVGNYNEDYFIDCIDIEFSLRVRHAGFSITKVADAVLYHELGAAHQVPKLFKRYYTLHSPLRRYYMYRNFMYFSQQYLRSDFRFTLKFGIAHGILCMLVLFYDPQPRASLRMMARGVRDFFSGKVGAYPLEKK